MMTTNSVVIVLRVRNYDNTKYEDRLIIPTPTTNNHLKPYRGYTVDVGERQNWMQKYRVSFDRASRVASPLSALTYRVLKY